MSRDPLYDDGVFTRLELLRKVNLKLKVLKIT